MNTGNENIIDINEFGVSVEPLTDEQVHHVYDKLSEVDKVSTDNLNNASEETESSNYTIEDNTEIQAIDEIPGVNITPASIAESVKETEKDIREIFDEYDLDDNSIVEMLKVIDEYKAGNQSSLYSRLPASIKKMVDGIFMTETNAHGNVSIKQVIPMKNNIAKMLVDSFINDAKISASVENFNSEMASAINEMNTEYDSMIGNAIDNTFNRIEEIRATDPDQAERIEVMKKAFDDAITFEKQLEFANKTSWNKFNKLLRRYEDEVIYFNNRVNNNFAGVKVPNVDELVPIIKYALPQYNENHIKKFIICICRTMEDVDTLAGIAYEYKMISSIYKYKYTNIDEAGEAIFNNISKVIDNNNI